MHTHHGHGKYKISSNPAAGSPLHRSALFHLSPAIRLSASASHYPASRYTVPFLFSIPPTSAPYPHPGPPPKRTPSPQASTVRSAATGKPPPRYHKPVSHASDRIASGQTKPPSPPPSFPTQLHPSSQNRIGSQRSCSAPVPISPKITARKKR